MPLRGHIAEMRRRIFAAAIALIIGAVIGWFTFDLVWAAVSRPIATIAAIRDHSAITLNYASITGAFDVRMEVAIVTGVVIASPVWLYQVLAFIVPAMTRRERRYVCGFVGGTVPLFFGGVIAGWAVLPHIVELLNSFVPPGSSAYYDARYYLDFVLKLILATGIAFVLPSVLVLLNFVGVLQGKSILRGWRWAVLGIGLFAAIATPAADVSSMLLLAMPMVVLYFSAVGITTVHDHRVERRARRMALTL